MTGVGARARLADGVRLFAESTLDLLFPRRCGLCGSFGSFVCAGCAAGLPLASAGARCPTCARLLIGETVHGRCNRCAPLASPTLDSLTPVFAFRDAARRLVHRLKYERLSALAEPMGALMVTHAAEVLARGCVLVPVPLHPARQRDRGFNQAALLARAISRRTGLPLEPRALIRVRRTDTQAHSADAAARAANVAGAFACRAALPASRVLLIDDVATTGATLRACALALRAAGASSVHALVFAHEE
jgi:ComF family protein